MDSSIRADQEFWVTSGARKAPDILVPVSTPQPSFARRTAVVLGAGLALVGATVAPAAADVPVGWSDPEPMSWLHLAGIALGIPALCALVIAALVMIPSLIRGEGFGVKLENNEWIGGPNGGTDQLSAAPDDEAHTGGASARF